MRQKIDSSIKLGKIMIIDGSFMVHRALNVDALYEMQTKDGVKTGAIYSFFTMLKKEMSNFPGYYPIVTLDAGLAPFRLEIYPDYKRHESKKHDAETQTPEEIAENEEYLKQYFAQREGIKEIASKLGIPVIEIKYNEGDDLMKLLSLMSDDNVIVTSDKDLLQLITECTRVRRPIQEQTFNTVQEFLDYEEIGSLREFVIIKAIMGDSSDNIGKVTEDSPRGKGVGDTGARQLAKIIIEHPDDYKEVIAKMDKTKFNEFLKYHDRFERNMKLVDLSIVEFSKEVISQVEQIIKNSVGKFDYFGAIGAFSKYEITTVSADDFISKLGILATGLVKEVG